VISEKDLLAHTTCVPRKRRKQQIDGWSGFMVGD